MEIKGKVLDLYFPTCPIRNIVARISDRWSLLVLLTLEPANKPMRFKELEAAIPDISQKMLTRTLRNLEADGLIRRNAYAEIPPRVEYSLTPRGLTLTPLLNSLVSWAMENLKDILSDRQAYQEKK